MCNDLNGGNEEMTSLGWMRLGEGINGLKGQVEDVMTS